MKFDIHLKAYFIHGRESNFTLIPTFSAFVLKIDAGYVHNNVEINYELRENRCSESRMLAICTYATRFR
jgi:hypothetical protein